MVTSASSASNESDDEPGAWLKLGVLTAASVVAGGLVAVWWHRNTLKKLRQAAETDRNPDFGISNSEFEDEP